MSTSLLTSPIRKHATCDSRRIARPLAGSERPCARGIAFRAEGAALSHVAPCFTPEGGDAFPNRRKALRFGAKLRGSTLIGGIMYPNWQKTLHPRTTA